MRRNGASAVKPSLGTAYVEEIRTDHRWGVLDGVTTNPALYAKEGGSQEAIPQEIQAGLAHGHLDRIEHLRDVGLEAEATCDRCG
jgi:transaldolase